MNMYTENFDKLFAQTENWVQPMLKANKLAIANMEKTVDLQFQTWQKYVNLGIDQLKAASEINNPESLQAFFTRQLETANTVRQEMLNDAKAFAELGTQIRDELTELGEESATELKKAASKTVKKAA